MFTFVVLVSLFFLILASIYDLKTSEIPDKVSLGFIVVIVFTAGVYSFVRWDPDFILNTLSLGFVYSMIGLLFFMLNQWGGGDTKLLGGIGFAVGLINSLGYEWPNTAILPYSVIFFINMGFVALPYALLYTSVLGLLKPEVFSAFTSVLMKKKTILVVALSTTPTVFASYLGYWSLALVYVLAPLFVVASVYLKACEKILFQKTINVSQLREGDVVAEDIIVGGKKIASKRSIEGLELGQVQSIKNLAAEGKIPSDITVKWGIKFVPIMLLAYILTVFAGNLMEILIIM